MLCKRGLCHYVVSMCPCVCLSRFVKINNHIFKIFSPSSSHTILVFPYQTSRQYSDGDPLTVASNAGGVGRNRDLGQYLAPPHVLTLSRYDTSVHLLIGVSCQTESITAGIWCKETSQEETKRVSIKLVIGWVTALWSGLVSALSSYSSITWLVVCSHYSVHCQPCALCIAAF